MCPLCIAATALLVSSGLSAGGLAVAPRIKRWRERGATTLPLCPASALAKREVEQRNTAG